MTAVTAAMAVTLATVSSRGQASITMICATPEKTIALIATASSRLNPCRAATVPNAMPNANSPGVSGRVAFTPSRKATNVQCGLKGFLLIMKTRPAALSFVWNQKKPQKQKARHAAGLCLQFLRLCLWLWRDFAGRRLGTRPRLACRRHRRGAWRGGLDDGLAHRALARKQISDFVTGQRLELEQALRQDFEIGALLGEDLRGLGIAGLDQAADFSVDLARGLFRNVLLARNLVAEENLVLVLAISNCAEFVRQTPARHHHARELGGLFDIGCRTRRHFLLSNYSMFCNDACDLDYDAV